MRTCWLWTGHEPLPVCCSSLLASAAAERHLQHQPGLPAGLLRGRAAAGGAQQHCAQVSRSCVTLLVVAHSPSVVPSPWPASHVAGPQKGKQASSLARPFGAVPARRQCCVRPAYRQSPDLETLRTCSASPPRLRAPTRPRPNVMWLPLCGRQRLYCGFRSARCDGTGFIREYGAGWDFQELGPTRLK
jgi:hypothetical protein